MKKKLGIVLSGGGMRAFSHLGVMKALFEANIQPNILAGTSMGSIVGLLIADGKKPDEILERAISYYSNTKHFIKPSLSHESLFNLEGLKSFLKETLTSRSFDELQIPLIVAATKLDYGTLSYFSEGDLITSVIASSSIPVFFPPVEIDHFRYVDGGVLANLPVKSIRSTCELIIGVNANPISVGEKRIKGFTHITERCFYLAIHSNMLEDIKLCDLFIEPKGLDQYQLLNFKQMRETYTLAYQYTKGILGGMNKEELSVFQSK